MSEKTLEKEIELREWQKMFNPSKVEAQASVILKSKPQNKDREANNCSYPFTW